MRQNAKRSGGAIWKAPYAMPRFEGRILKMKYRQLGKSGLRLSEVGLGSWITYGGATDNSTAVACIDKAYELGINFFDTANVYAGGEAEKVVGKALSKYERSSYALATKVFFPMGSGPNDRGLSRKHIFEQCHKSLKRLGADYIDLYQCHRYDPSVPIEEVFLALSDLARQGKILYYGVSEWPGHKIAEASAFLKEWRLHPIASNQPHYNLLGRRIEREVIPASEAAGVGQVVFSPLAQGILSGKYKPGSPLPEGTRAADPKQNMFLNGGKLDQNVLEAVQKLVPIADGLGITLAQLSLAWCLRLSNITSVIIGASRPSQVEENAKASDVVLTPEMLEAIDKALEGAISY